MLEGQIKKVSNIVPVIEKLEASQEHGQERSIEIYDKETNKYQYVLHESVLRHNYGAFFFVIALQRLEH